MKWKRAMPGGEYAFEEVYEENHAASDEGEVIITLGERLILSQCGLSVEKYIEAKTPNPHSVPTSGIVSYCFNHGWYVEYNLDINKYNIVGRVEI